MAPKSGRSQSLEGDDWARVVQLGLQMPVDGSRTVLKHLTGDGLPNVHAKTVCMVCMVFPRGGVKDGALR